MIGGGLFLADRCDVKRPSKSVQAYGSKDVPQNHLSDEPCWLETKTQRGFSSITGQWVVTTTYDLHVRNGRDLREGDIITNIRLQDGTLLTNEFSVDGGVIPTRGRMLAVTTLSLKQVA